MGPIFTEWWQVIKHLLFPQCRCFSCGQGEGLDESGLCPTCRKKIEEINHHYKPCCYCAAFISKVETYCINCHQKKEHWFDAARAVFPYEGDIRQIIHDFKYRGVREWAVPLGRLMVKTIRQEDGFKDMDIITPVPLHVNRQKIRGYNQSDLLAREISKGLNIPLMTDLMSRIVDTPSQTGLNKKLRHENLAQAFELTGDREVKEKIILLVDDIFTTGSTVEACSRILKIGGAKKVFVVTCAAGKSS